MFDVVRVLEVYEPHAECLPSPRAQTVAPELHRRNSLMGFTQYPYLGNISHSHFAPFLHMF